MYRYSTLVYIRELRGRVCLRVNAQWATPSGNNINRLTVPPCPSLPLVRVCVCVCRTRAVGDRFNLDTRMWTRHVVEWDDVCHTLK